MGVAAPVLANVKIAKNAQLVAVIKYIYFEMEGALEGALSSTNILYDLRRFAISCLKLVPPSTVSLGHN